MSGERKSRGGIMVAGAVEAAKAAEMPKTPKTKLKASEADRVSRS